jgi:hypothetical protein
LSLKFVLKERISALIMLYGQLTIPGSRLTSRE